MDLSVRRWFVKRFHRDWLSAGVSIHKNQYLNCCFFFKIKNNINFVCEFWDHCIYESPHTSSMAAWRWFNMARRGTQHWSLPTVWGKVSSRLALYAGKPLFSILWLWVFIFCLFIIQFYEFLFDGYFCLHSTFFIFFQEAFNDCLRYQFLLFLGGFLLSLLFPNLHLVFFFVSSFKPQKIILHMIKTPSRFQNNQQLHSTKM